MKTVFYVLLVGINVFIWLETWNVFYRYFLFSLFYVLIILLGFSGGSVVENLPATQETPKTRVRSLNQEDPLEKEMATHSSIPTLCES